MNSNEFHYVPSSAQLINDQEFLDKNNNIEHDLSNESHIINRNKNEPFRFSQKLNNIDNVNSNVNISKKSSSIKRLITTGKNILSPSLSTNKIFNHKPSVVLSKSPRNNCNESSRSSFKLHKYQHQNSDQDNNSKHEIVFRFKKNRSLSHSYTTGYDIYDDENGDEKQIVDEDDDEDEDDDDDDDEDDGEDGKDETNEKINNEILKLNYLNSSNSKAKISSKSFAEMSPRPKLNLTSSSNLQQTQTNANQSNSRLGDSRTVSSNETSSLSSSSKILMTNSDNNSSSSSDLSTNQAKAELISTTNNKVFIKYTKSSGEDLDVIILDEKTVATNLNEKNKRADSIRMRHYSNAANSTNTVNRLSVATVDSGSKEGVGKARLFRIWKRNNSAKQKRNNYFVIFLLFVVNLINYIDRYTLAGVLPEIQKYFGINDGESGLLQTVFICSYMLLAPVFGYLGDRYSRKWIIIFGISFWSFMTFIGSFIPPDKFWLFALIRSLVGIGEASYSCVAPTIIGDLFTNELRTKMLAIFYLAVPVGSGMGYIVGSNVASAFNNWKWALRITPPFGFLCILLLLIVFKDPKRGGAEGSLAEESSTSSVWQDLVYLIKNKTFIWITLGFTFASFVLGGLSWWVPTFVQYGIYSNNQVPEQVPLKFGVVTVISGLVGVGASSVIAAKLRTVTKFADPLVCALGSLIAVPSLFVLVLITRTANQYLFWFIAFIAITAMCLSWTIVADILLYTIYPSKRSIASAFNILICHLFGDAGSPYVIGLISDSLRSGKPDTFYNKFTSLQMALYAGPFFAAMSFACYLFAAIYVVDDKKQVDDFIRKNQKSFSEVTAPTQLNSSNEITSNENSQKDDDPGVVVNVTNKHKNSSTTTTNEISSNKVGTQNENFTDSKTEIADIESTNSAVNLLHKKN